jgi:hypothetical protein
MVSFGHQELLLLQKVERPGGRRRLPQDEARRSPGESPAKPLAPRSDFLQGPGFQESAVIEVALVAKNLPVAYQVAMPGRIKFFAAPGTFHERFPS